MLIGKLKVGADAPPVVVAELSGNHNGSLQRALAIVDSAAACGAQALKLQTYTADTMTLDIKEREFFISNPDSLWKGRSLYELYQEAFTPWEWHEPLFRRANELGMVAFSTPFDATSVEFLESLKVPAYKIASFENIDLPLIRRVAATGKPIIMSTGMATLAELDEAVAAAREAGCREMLLLQCTSSYPADPAHSNLANIPRLRELFNCEVGLSDHTLGIGASIASVALGATLIERHFTLARADGGVDAVFSLEPAELQQLVQESRTAWQALGSVHIGPTAIEMGSRGMRRSLYICEDLAAGAVLTGKNLRAIRPGLGLPPKFLEQLLGKRVNRTVPRGTPASWDLIG